jgi:hypothetical protein
MLAGAPDDARASGEIGRFVAWLKERTVRRFDGYATLHGASGTHLDRFRGRRLRTD